MDYQKFFDTGKMLFEHFGWYSLLLVLGTTLLMIPLNLLYKKLMKKESLSRLRKTISCLSVYLVALALITFFTGVVLKEPITFGYLFTASMNCGLLSMLLWAIIKFARDYGVLPIVNVVLANKEAKKWLSEVGISSKLVDAITEKVKAYIKEKNIKSLDEYLQKETDIIGQLRLQVAGFVTSENVHKTITNILQPIKDKLK